ncbi:MULTISPECIES: LOG family protein [unclassified Iodobacter]|uniref:LOG family protein n=1 Tax=unclassified Iodobacter TaxID=235634 RepID=UPI0025CC5857|nr:MULTISPECIES: LOG family protein [unclassified Iodobacter]MDW5416896.1 LOG family protein [Iodobacter sp. CM08]
MINPNNKPIGVIDDEQALDIVGDAVLKLWDVVDELARLRPAHTPDYHVTIFGSARIQEGSAAYEAVKQLASELAAMGCRIVTGGGPGLMQAANEGARDGAPDRPEASVGIRVDLDFEQNVNDFVGKVYEHKTFFSRLHHFILRSNAFIVTSGGIGTLLELAMVWQLIQVRKLYDTPLILVGEMWHEQVDWARRYMVENNAGLASEVDMQIPIVVDTIEDAVQLIREHHEKWEQTGYSLNN